MREDRKSLSLLGLEFVARNVGVGIILYWIQDLLDIHNLIMSILVYVVVGAVFLLSSYEILDRTNDRFIYTTNWEEFLNYYIFRMAIYIAFEYLIFNPAIMGKLGKTLCIATTITALLYSGVIVFFKVKRRKLAHEGR